MPCSRGRRRWATSCRRSFRTPTLAKRGKNGGYIQSQLEERFRIKLIDRSSIARSSFNRLAALTHRPSTWLMTLSGRTQTHTVMSDAASDTMKKFGVIWVVGFGRSRFFSIVYVPDGAAKVKVRHWFGNLKLNHQLRNLLKSSIHDSFRNAELELISPFTIHESPTAKWKEYFRLWTIPFYQNTRFTFLLLK